MHMRNVSTIDEYIADYATPVQQILQKIRQTIHAAAPEAVEAIRYGLATFRLKDKNLVHFGAYDTHIGFYPAPSGITAFQAELAPFITGKGTIQFPLTGPVPYELIAKVTAFRAQEISTQSARGKK